MPGRRGVVRVAKGDRRLKAGARLVVSIAAAWLAGLAATGAATGARAESSKDDWFDEDCQPKVQKRWCEARLVNFGWMLKYRTESPKDLADAFWLVEVWIKGEDALVLSWVGPQPRAAAASGVARTLPAADGRRDGNDAR